MSLRLSAHVLKCLQLGVEVQNGRYSLIERIGMQDDNNHVQVHYHHYYYDTSHNYGISSENLHRLGAD
jgi:hypothetical protein